MAFEFMTLRERVEQMLADTSNDIWDKNWIEEALRQALMEYSQFNPQEAIGTVTLASSTYELDVSTLTSLLSVKAVWSPYTASSPENPPNVVLIEHWKDSQLAYAPDYQFQSGNVARVFYTKLHTISGHDAETTTSVDEQDELLIAIGTAGHAATSRAVDLSEKVSVGQLTAQQVRAWGMSKLQEFRNGLNGVSRRLALRSTSRVLLPRLDRWDREGRGWV